MSTSIPINAGYKALGLDIPDIIWTGSPLESIITALIHHTYVGDEGDRIFTAIKALRPTPLIHRIPGNYSTMFQPIAIAEASTIDQLVENHVMDVLDKAQSPEVGRLIRVGRHSSWAFCFPNATLWCKPPEVSRDNNGRPHSTVGPAIKYQTQEIYAMHGRMIPNYWIINGKPQLTIAQALETTNIELRRLALELIGWKRVLKHIKATILNRDPDPEIGTLWVGEIPGYGRQNFLEVKCGTGRKFIIPVPPEVRTALQANAWTYGLDNPKDARVEIRT